MDIIGAFQEMISKQQKEGREINAPALILLDKDNETVAQSYSWPDYFKQAVCFAAALRKLQLVKEGELATDRPQFVVLLPLNLPESFFALFGTILAGGIPVPLNALALKDPYGIKQLKFALNHSGQTKTVLANQELKEKLNQEEIDFISFNQLLAIGRLTVKNDPLITAIPFYHRRTEKDLLIMPYTSGTSGSPKGVMLSQLNILDRVQAVSEEFKINGQERLLSYLPLGHIAALIADFFGQLLNGYAIYCSRHAAQTEEMKKNMVAILKKVQPTIFLGVPRVWHNLHQGVANKINQGWRRFIPRHFLAQKVKEGLGFTKTKLFVTAAAKPDKAALKFFCRLNMAIDNVYGQTETAGPLLLNGKTIGPQTRIWLDQEREILVSGPNVMLGYYRNPEATARSLSTDLLAGQEVTVYHTQDLGQEKEMAGYPTLEFIANQGRGYKNTQGDFVSGDILAKKEEHLKDWLVKYDPQLREAEIFIYGADRPFNILLVFVFGKSAAERKELEEVLGSVSFEEGEEGSKEKLYRLKGVLVFDLANLIVNATMKICWTASLAQPIIEKKIETFYQNNN